MLILGSKFLERDGGETPLELALRTKQEDVARSLIGHGAGTDERNAAGHAPLHTAILEGECRASSDASVSCLEPKCSELAACRRSGDCWEASFLLDSGASPSLPTAPARLTPLHLLAASPHAAVRPLLKRLLSLSCDVNALDRDG
ncbi:unnamed protein product, partial [Darwinula stevensoni]